MNGDIIIAMLSLFGTLVGSLGGIIVSSKLTNYPEASGSRGADKVH